MEVVELMKRCQLQVIFERQSLKDLLINKTEEREKEASRMMPTFSGPSNRKMLSSEKGKTIVFPTSL